MSHYDDNRYFSESDAFLADVYEAVEAGERKFLTRDEIATGLETVADRIRSDT